MQAFIKAVYTFITVISVFLSSVFSPATLLPESENLSLSYLEYPKEAVMTLEEAGITEAELCFRADASHEEYVQSGGYDDINGVLFENIEIFRDEGRAILVKIYEEGKENFTIDNVVFRNITYTSYMPSKIDGNGSDTNTLNAKIENVSGNGFAVSGKGARFTVGKHCNVDFTK
ncbi:MAG: hypothetical protein IJO03_02540 [Clostridia bacterium]|nr:hypothetical protein [Clostridia bacterium]